MPRPAPVTIATLPSKSPIDPVPLFGSSPASEASDKSPRVTTGRWSIRSPDGCVSRDSPPICPGPPPSRSSSTSRSSTATSTAPTTRSGPSPTHLYGGQVAAQALRAAGLTVPDDRFPHSLHGYYLRSGEAEHPTIMKVSRDRDGRSFSARRVSRAATRRGDLHRVGVVPRRRGERRLLGGALAPDLPAPEEIADERLAATTTCSWTSAAGATPRRRRRARWSVSRRMWGRTRERLSDDRVLHRPAGSSTSPT